METDTTQQRANGRKATKLTLPLLERHLERATDQLRGKVDPSEYKNILLGLLFYKRVADQFQERYQRILAQEMGRGKNEEEARRDAEDPYRYTGALYVPPSARWPEMQARAASRKDIAGHLNRAMLHLSQENETLRGVLTHIDFGRKFGRSSISDQTLSDLVDQFSQLDLSDERIAVPDILGTAYDHLIRDFSFSGGRAGGEFYTPPEVAKLLVRLLKPGKGMKLYDPCVGSGGLLLEGARYIREMGEDIHQVQFCGQDSNGGAWALCVMNMLMHGIITAWIENEDTLLHPRHIDANGTLTRFDRIISNPPFSANYETGEMEFTERFPFFCPQTGKRGDLMFVQHMLSVLRPGGMIATVLPHGVLFRGGIELRIRRWLIQELDALEAVIGLPAGLFYGTGIPACILTLRSPGTKPTERQGKILFVNAEEEYGAGRGQNHLRPEDSEKIASCFEAFCTIPGYAQIVEREELERNEINLNLRRYVDPVPTLDPYDVRGLWLGCVPKVEVAARQELFTGHGLEVTAVFTDHDDAYYDFVPDLSKRQCIEARVSNHPGVQAKERDIDEVFLTWWGKEGKSVLDTRTRPTLAEIRAHLKATLIQALLPAGLLNETQIAGSFARWWEAQHKELQMLSQMGTAELLNEWVSSFSEHLERQDRHESYAREVAPPLLAALLPNEIAHLSEAQTRIFDLEQEQTAWEMKDSEIDEEENKDEDEDEAEEAKSRPRSRMHDLQQRISVIKGTLKKHKCTKLPGTKADERDGQEADICELRTQLEAYQQALAPYLERKTQLSEARKQLHTQREALAFHLQQAAQDLTVPAQEHLILTILGEELHAQLKYATVAHRKELISAIEIWFDAYSEGIMQIEAQRDAAERRVKEILSGLGYF